ncbi:hypothetical protein WJX84_004035 [Apatococcus fuscideae]|uniref:Uncharacterized protein n=1 Tax=Apatococcus fuscideae TaxID=2026836 RepID=A0AAW1SRH1_9CHLO
MLDLGVVSATIYTWNKGGGYQPLQPRFIVHQGLARSTAVTASWQLPEAGLNPQGSSKVHCRVHFTRSSQIGSIGPPRSTGLTSAEILERYTDWVSLVNITAAIFSACVKNEADRGWTSLVLLVLEL